MHQSRTLYGGLDVHTESLAVASVAKEDPAEVVRSAPLAPANVPSIIRPAAPVQKNLASLSMKLALAGTGSPAL